MYSTSAKPMLSIVGRPTVVWLNMLYMHSLLEKPTAVLVYLGSQSKLVLLLQLRVNRSVEEGPEIKANKDRN